MPISLPQEASLAAHRLPPTNDPRAHPAYPGRPRGRAGHCPTPPDDDGQVHTDASAGPAPPAPASSTRLRPRADHEPGMDAAGDHADPGHPSRTAACPTAAPQDLTPAGPADAATHRHRTPTPDAGQRTPDSGHLDAHTPAPDTGHRSRGQASVDTGRSHRTPDTGRWPRTRTGDDGAAGIRTSRATTPSDRALGRPTVYLWTGACGARQPMQARR